MKKVYLFLLLLFLSATCCFSQKNLTLLSIYTVSPGLTYAGVYHYDDSLGNEYALLGTNHGLTIVDITNPASPQHIFDVPNSVSEWREVKVWSHYAYFSSEGGHLGGGGITIVDLSTLPAAPAYKKYIGDGAIDSLLSTAHTVEIAGGYLYINGARRPNGQYLENGGCIICSLANPWNPAFVGAYTLNYVHDCFVRGDTLVTSEIFANPAGEFAIVNISDKANPVLLTTNPTPFKFNHNTWMSDDDHYLFTTDEKPDAPLGSFDISDLSNIQQVDLYWTSKNPVGEVHNVRVLNDFLINACYGDATHTGPQVTLVDASRPANLIEVGNYPLNPTPVTRISWDVDPYLQSGNIIATEYVNGLFVFAPTYIRACHLEGTVTDSITGASLNDVKIQILRLPEDTSVLATDSSLFTGSYKTGLADSGTYDIRFSPSAALADSGYVGKTTTGVVLTNGVLTTLNVKLHKQINGLHEKTVAPPLFHAYPNPAHSNLSVIIDPSVLNANHHLRFLMTDATGRTVREVTDVTQSTITIDRSGIANGSYNLQLTDNEIKIAEVNIILQ